MANSTTSHQIPQHVSALLSHLTSRPGVQSTLILSRKDGSIIQTTGLLAPQTPRRARSETSSPAPVAPAPPVPEAGADAVPTTTDATPTSPNSTETTTQTQIPTATAASIPLPTSPQPQQPAKPYQPTQAESLAAHIFAYVSSASSLSFALSHPLGNGDSTPSSNANGIHGPPTRGIGNGPTGGTGADGEGDGFEGQDEDEVKLLRLRTKKHEIVVVPDRKYLLCVVQDGTGVAAGAPGGAGLATGRLR
ncbi:uncharacterized protein BDV14DRAFT_175839 [Aspergillus stella-maris]|uniref:uncharacterized protein n=1 Tax=Aspergillus stella-maris TaxID=1810926 RepID=UPI003CCD18E3